MNARRIEGAVALVTGANRGIGQALVNEALRRGAKRYMRERAARCETSISA